LSGQARQRQTSEFLKKTRIKISNAILVADFKCSLICDILVPSSNIHIKTKSSDAFLQMIHLFERKINRTVKAGLKCRFNFDCKFLLQPIVMAI